MAARSAAPGEKQRKKLQGDYIRQQQGYTGAAAAAMTLAAAQHRNGS